MLWDMRPDNKSFAHDTEYLLAEQRVKQAVSEIQRATRRKDFDPHLRKSIEKASRFVTVSNEASFRQALADHYAEIAHPDTDQFLIERSIGAMATVKNALVLRNLDHTLRAIHIKSSAVPEMLPEDLVELLGEEFGHIVGYKKDVAVAGLNPSSRQESQILHEIAERKIQAESVKIEGYNTHFIKDGYVIGNVPLHSYLEELRAQTLGLYIKAHVEGQKRGIHFNKAVQTNRTSMQQLYPLLSQELQTRMDKAEYLYRTCDSLGWDTVVPVLTGANLDTYFNLLDTDPSGTVHSYVRGFIALEMNEM